MSGLHKVLKAYRYELDQKRQELMRLQRMMSELENEAGVLEKRLLEEAEVAFSSPDTSVYYTEYRHYVKGRRKEIDRMLEELSEQIDSKTDEVIDSYQDVKKVEIISDRKKEDLLKEEQKLEQDQNDEMALNQYRKSRTN